MNVLYYDVLPLMPLGTARQTETLEEMLGGESGTDARPRISDTETN